MTYIKVERNLILKEDLCLGAGTVNQTRNKASITGNKITLIEPVSTHADLQALDTNKYLYAFCLGGDEPNDTNGGLYYFDLDNVSEELSADIIKSTTTNVGRWVRIAISSDTSFKTYVDEKDATLKTELSAKDDELLKGYQDADTALKTELTEKIDAINTELTTKIDNALQELNDVTTKFTGTQVIADATSTTIVQQMNTLLAVLRNMGIVKE